MAKIVPSTLAPSEPFSITFADAVIELDGSQKTSALETDDSAVIAAARTHPWVTVESEPDEGFVGDYKRALDPRLDPLSAQHPSAKEATSTEAARAFAEANAQPQPVAIDAGLDQDKPTTTETGNVAKTLAAVEDAPKTTSKEKK